MKRVFLSLLALLMLAIPARGEGVSVDARSCILMEKETGQILWGENEHEKLEPASITKVMTLLLVMEEIDSGRLAYDDTVTASAHASSMGGSQIWLKENEQMSVEDMLKAVCVVSANDCAVALGEHVAGSHGAFVERMNERAAQLGMADTHFVNCTGIPADGHVTSAHDVAIMSRELILRHPDIRRFTTLWMDSLREGTSELVNTNKLIRFYDGATGLKTGSTDSALYCLSATAEREGMELIAVVLKSPTSTARFESAKALLNYGFAGYRLERVTPEQPLSAVGVRLGSRESVPAVLGEGSTLLLEKSAGALEQEVTLAEELKAPVERGQQVGQLRVLSGGEEVAVIPIVAGESAARLRYGEILVDFLRKAFLLEPFRG